MCVFRNERHPVRFCGSEGHRTSAKWQHDPESKQNPNAAPGADDGDAGVSAADGQLPSYHGRTLC